MQNTNDTLSLEFFRDIFDALAGADAMSFDADDVAALLAQGYVTASFGISHCLNDIENVVNSVWRYPAGARHVDAIVVVRGNGMDMNRYKAIHGELRRKMHETSSLLISVSKSKLLPVGTTSIILIAIEHTAS